MNLKSKIEYAEREQERTYELCNLSAKEVTKHPVRLVAIQGHMNNVIDYIAKTAVVRALNGIARCAPPSVSGWDWREDDE